MAVLKDRSSTTSAASGGWGTGRAWTRREVAGGGKLGPAEQTSVSSCSVGEGRNVRAPGGENRAGRAMAEGQNHVVEAHRALRRKRLH